MELVAGEWAASDLFPPASCRQKLASRQFRPVA